MFRMNLVRKSYPYSTQYQTWAVQDFIKCKQVNYFPLKYHQVINWTKIPRQIVTFQFSCDLHDSTGFQRSSLFDLSGICHKRLQSPMFYTMTFPGHGYLLWKIFIHKIVHSLMKKQFLLWLIIYITRALKFIR